MTGGTNGVQADNKKTTGRKTNTGLRNVWSIKVMMEQRLLNRGGSQVEESEKRTSKAS